MRGLFVAGIGLLACAGVADAADLTAVMAMKAPPQPAPAYSDWTGAYLGAHLGYAWGSSDWTATSAGAPPLAGGLDLFNSFDAFRGTGSYLGGFQAGYNYVLPSRLVLGAEADISFPNTLAGTSILASPAIGTATYLDQVEFSGSLRGRIGYAPGNWLFYVTGGFAWSYDQFTRTQAAGVAGAAAPGTVENHFIGPRAGWTAGGGVEVALPSHWAARLEYLFSDYASKGVTFPASAQTFTSDLAVSQVRFGLDYRFNDNSIAADNKATVPALETANFAVHGQATLVEQYAPPFRSPYVGTNSLIPNQGRETADATLYLGMRLWSGAEAWLNPELDQGFGLNGTVGLAGFSSGEAYKVGASVPYPRVPRAFIRQTVNLGGETEKLESAGNQFSGTQTENRLVLTLGKFAPTDIFDNNKYAHDPRGDFMNWSLVDTGTFDYAADAWGFTYGAAVEWYQGPWTVRGGVFDLSIVPNSTQLDPQFRQFQWIGEVERRYDLWGHPGKLAVTGFLSRGRMGSFNDALQLAAVAGPPADITQVRQYGSRAGISANLEQEITETLGVFARAGIADGGVEPYEFTDVDRTVAAGLQLAGKQWGRPDDTFGLAGVINGITGVHEAYLNAGGLGILVGDGTLPHAGSERIIETYYSLPVPYMRLTLDYQFVVNPAYNADRGPVSVLSARLHTQF